MKWARQRGGSEVGQGHERDLLAAPGEEHRVRWLPAELSTTGTTVEVETEWGTRTATVVEMPFVDPNKQIPVS